MVTMERHSVLALTDEDELMARIANLVGRLADVEIRAAHDSLRLVEAYLCRHARLVILDAGLARDQIVRLAHIVRQVEPDCPLLLFVSPDELVFCTRLLPLGRVSYLVKPVCARAAADLICACLQVPGGHSDDVLRD